MGHWYKRSGEPCHFVPDAKGNSRPATLADARKLGLIPGFSGVDKLIANPFLERWKTDQAVLAALTLTRGPEESDEAFLDRIATDGSARAVEARKEGKAIHQAIEASFRAEGFPERFRPHVAAARRMLEDNFPGVTDWVSEATFGCSRGYGGAIDLYSPSHRIIVDYKGADISPEDPRKRVAYTQHRQLAAYAEGLGWKKYEAANLFVSRTHPGYVRYHSWSPDELEEGLDTFLHALAIWQNVNRYDTSWTP